jgi:hypothetical protein
MLAKPPGVDTGTPSRQLSSLHWRDFEQLRESVPAGRHGSWRLGGPTSRLAAGRPAATGSAHVICGKVRRCDEGAFVGGQALVTVAG